MQLQPIDDITFFACTILLKCLFGSKIQPKDILKCNPKTMANEKKNPVAGERVGAEGEVWHKKCTIFGRL